MTSSARLSARTCQKYNISLDSCCLRLVTTNYDVITQNPRWPTKTGSSIDTVLIITWTQIFDAVMHCLQHGATK
jgi:predicted secreted Zn-dependent protease